MIQIKTFPAPAVDEREILRYAGVRGEAPELENVMHRCLDEAAGQLTYRVCWREFDIAFHDGGTDLGFAWTDSADLARNLRGCERAVVFGATVGLELDRLIARYSRLSPAKAVMLQAIGAERIEALCDEFCRQLGESERQRGCTLRPRFSPGYGDLPLGLQRDIFAALNCQKAIGLTLNESLLMSPTKSVTAIVGIAQI